MDGKRIVKGESKILISACLLGDKVRYDGRDNSVDNQILHRWRAEGRLVAICPEVAGGLSTPRAPAEIQNGDGNTVIAKQTVILTIDNQNVTDQFQLGAEKALQLAVQHRCKYALLAARSPSCGNEMIYDGQFKNQLKVGVGVTTALLQQHGIKVFNQGQIRQLNELLEAIAQV